MMKKKKKICAEKLNFGLLPKYIARLGSWAWRWARLLGVQALGARGARRQTCVGARARAQVGVGARGALAGARSAGGRAERWRARGALAGARSAGGRAERWRARGRAAGRAGAWAAATPGARGGARGAHAGAREAAGWATWERPGCAAGPGWVFGAPNSVFGLV